MTSGLPKHPFLEALAGAGVSAEALTEVSASSRSPVTVGFLLLQRGLASAEQIEAAQRSWAAREQPLPKRVLRVGPYIIERRLGSGAAGEVYLVRDPASGARRAAKQLIDLGDAEERLRFQREARLLSEFNHPNLARIHAAELTGPSPYFVLDYYSGGSLEQRLTKGGPLKENEARELVDKIASGLEAAHAQGVLHRDLKPHNVLLDEHGEPRLADFGLGLRLTAHSNRLTQTGVVMGTPSYMAPEQVTDAKRVDARSDVYGLGAIFYHCLTGQPPFPVRSTLIATLMAVVEEQAPAPRTLASVSSGLEAVCLQALEKNPRDRFQTVAEFRQALRNSGADRAPHRSWTSLGLVLGAVGVALASLATVLVVSRADPAQVTGHAASETSETDVPPRTPTVVQRVESALAKGGSEVSVQLLLQLREQRGQGPLALIVLRALEHDAPFDVAAPLPTQDALVLTVLLEVDALRAELAALLPSAQQDRKQIGVLLESLVGEVNALPNLAAWSDLGDALLLEVVDVCHRAQVAVRISETQWVVDRLKLKSDEVPQASLAHQVVLHLVEARNLASSERSAGSPLTRWLLVTRGQVVEGPALLGWPPFLVCELLGAPRWSPVPEDAVQRWLHELPKDLPAPSRGFDKLLLDLAALLLCNGAATDAPNYALAQEIAGRAAGVNLSGGHQVAQAIRALTAGDLRSAEAAVVRFKPSLPASHPARLLYAALQIERARATPPGKRAGFLSRASGALEHATSSRAVWAMQQHAWVLGQEESEPCAPPDGEWADQPALNPVREPCPPWYVRYTPEHAFPEEDDTRPQVWLPN